MSEENDLLNNCLNKGDFLFHEYYGVGKITFISDQQRLVKLPGGKTQHIFDIEIEFSDSEKKVFSSELVRRSMIKLSIEGFRVFMFLNPEEASHLIKEKPVEVIKKVLQDFPDKEAKTEQIKDYLKKDVENWEEWWKKVQGKIKESDWIDSSQSKRQIYRINPDKISPDQEAYLNYRLIKRGGSVDEVYVEAKKALAQFKPDPEKEDERIDDLVAYFNSCVANENLSINNRVDAVFRLVDGKWITEKKVEEHIQKILQYEFSLYQLDMYPLNRLVEYLLKYPKNERIESLLLSGICGNEITIKAVTDWVRRKSDINLLERTVINALINNLPDDDSTPSAITAFKFRIQSVKILSTYLPNEFPGWEKIIECLPALIQQVAGLKSSDNQHYILNPVLDFLDALTRRLQNLDSKFIDELFTGMVSPDLPIEFILRELNAIKSHANPEFAKTFSKKFEESLSLRNDNFLDPIISESSEDGVKTVEKLISLFHKFPNTHLADLAIEKVKQIISSSSDDQRVNFIPYLDQLQRWPGNPTWKKEIIGQREKAYYSLLIEHNVGNGYKDESLFFVVDQVLKIKTKQYAEEIRKKEEIISKLEDEYSKNEQLLAERAVVITELQSRPSGNVQEARFKERIKILLDLVTSLAEFERYQASLQEKSKEIEAVLKRFNSILSGYNISTTEGIGCEVKFNPQKHHSVDSTVLNVGDNVIIVERGFLIRDFDENLRLLKPALIRKA